MRVIVTVWQFIAGDSRSAPIGIALAIVIAIVLERTGAPGWTIPLAFTACVAVALAAALRETA